MESDCVGLRNREMRCLSGRLRLIHTEKRAGGSSARRGACLTVMETVNMFLDQVDDSIPPPLLATWMRRNRTSRIQQ